MTITSERRAASHRGALGTNFDACIVRKAILVQRRASTPSAVEYLKANDVDPRVIERVLWGAALRLEARLM